MTTNTKKQRRLGIAGLALSLALFAAACGGSESNSGDIPTESETVVTDEGDSSSDGFELALYVQRPNVQLGLSIECYQFYSDGTVELRHGSSNFETVNDTGVAYGDESGGQIDWNSGRSTSYAAEGGTDYRVDGAIGEAIGTCV